MIAAKTTVKNPAVCPLVLKITNEIKKRAIGKNATNALSQRLFSGS